MPSESARRESPAGKRAQWGSGRISARLARVIAVAAVLLIIFGGFYVVFAQAFARTYQSPGCTNTADTFTQGNDVYVTFSQETSTAGFAAIWTGTSTVYSQGIGGAAFATCQTFSPTAAGTYSADIWQTTSGTAEVMGPAVFTVDPPATTTSVTCTPASVSVGSRGTCTATVSGTSPTGTITWSQSGTGSVHFSSSTCSLSLGSCTVKDAGLTSGSVTIQGSYGGDSNNAASSGTFSLSLTVASPSISPNVGPAGATTTLSGSSFSFSYTYNYCYEPGLALGSGTVCSSAHQFTTDSSGNIPAGTTITTSGSSNGLVVISDPNTSSVLFQAIFFIPGIALSPTLAPVGSTVSVSGTGFSPGVAIGTFTYAGSTPTTQTCTGQTTSSTGAFSCTFVVPSSTGANTVTASGLDTSTVPGDTASATFTVGTPLVEAPGPETPFGEMASPFTNFQTTDSSGEPLTAVGYVILVTPAETSLIGLNYTVWDNSGATPYHGSATIGPVSLGEFCTGADSFLYLGSGVPPGCLTWVPVDYWQFSFTLTPFTGEPYYAPTIVSITVHTTPQPQDATGWHSMNSLFIWTGTD